MSNVTESLTEARLRLSLLGILFCLGFLLVSARLVDLTLLREKPKSVTALIDDEEVRLDTGATLRGTILDRNGELIATTLKMASVYADTTLVRNPKTLAKHLTDILPETDALAIEKKLSSGKKFIWIARNITPRQEYAINALGDPALSFQQEDRRIYPHGPLTAHVSGYTDIDGQGISGIEKSFNRQLAENNAPLRLTLDLRVQHILQRELKKSMAHFKAKAATGIVMDTRNGDVIALVSLPDFDPQAPGKSSADARFNRATLGVFEMGSTMKLFPLAAALDSGKAQMGSTYDATEPLKFGRFTISDFHALKRVMTLPEVFIHSSNIATAKIALSLGDDMRAFYERLGFFEPLSFDLPERGRPLLPRNWKDINIATASFGHGIAISPLQLVRATAALVNDGIMVQPRLVMNENKALKKQATVISAKTSLQIRQLLDLVVVAGTGSKAAVEGYGVGGKTGTAEKTKAGGYAQNALLSSFIGVFPIAQPRYVVLAIIDEPLPQPDTEGYATGGWTAAPVVARVIEQMAPLYQIPPDFDSIEPLSKNLFTYLKEKPEGQNFAHLRTDR
jgi:cell division protein FtsI (penicillin-binding protein 3)